ncbi:MAG: TetR/AcrR family transcriptional regulator [Firmicutes bacterium]|nr:TetR/AcrR family transcriptional regulator [Bacillota bacterium]
MGNRRQEILSKAREMFSRRSFHAVSMEDITRSLGMGKSTMYHYFATKQELWKAVIKDTVGGLYRFVLAQVMADESYDTQIFQLVSSILTYFEDNRDDFMVLLRERMDFLDLEAIKEQLDPEFWAEYDRFIDHFRAMIIAGQSVGLFVSVDPNLILANIFGTINTAALSRVISEPDRELTELIDGCYQVIMGGIAAPETNQKK